jgi:hypothetical protein
VAAAAVEEGLVGQDAAEDDAGQVRGHGGREYGAARAMDRVGDGMGWNGTDARANEGVKCGRGP